MAICSPPIARRNQRLRFWLASCTVKVFMVEEYFIVQRATSLQIPLTLRDGGNVEDRIRLGQGIVAGVIAERAFVAQRLARVNVAFDDEIRVGQNGFQFGYNVFKTPRTDAKERADKDLPTRVKMC